MLSKGPEATLLRMWDRSTVGGTLDRKKSSCKHLTDVGVYVCVYV